MGAFNVDLMPSRWRKWGILAWAMVLIFVVGLYFFGTTRWLLFFGIVASTWYGWNENRYFIQKIEIDDEYEAHLYFSHSKRKKYPATLLAGSLIFRFLCLLKWRCDGKTHYQCILPDSLDEDDFRRLRVWARWCQKK